MNNEYKVTENYNGEIFIIKSGMRQMWLGNFNYLAEAQEKCDELNNQLSDK